MVQTRLDNRFAYRFANKLRFFSWVLFFLLKASPSTQAVPCDCSCMLYIHLSQSCAWRGRIRYLRNYRCRVLLLPQTWTLKSQRAAKHHALPTYSVYINLLCFPYTSSIIFLLHLLYRNNSIISARGSDLTPNLLYLEISISDQPWHTFWHPARWKTWFAQALVFCQLRRPSRRTWTPGTPFGSNGLERSNTSWLGFRCLIDNR